MLRLRTFISIIHIQSLLSSLGRNPAELHVFINNKKCTLQVNTAICNTFLYVHTNYVPCFKPWVVSFLCYCRCRRRYYCYAYYNSLFYCTCFACYNTVYIIVLYSENKLLINLNTLLLFTYKCTDFKTFYTSLFLSLS